MLWGGKLQNGDFQISIRHTHHIPHHEYYVIMNENDYQKILIAFLFGLWYGVTSPHIGKRGKSILLIGVGRLWVYVLALWQHDHVALKGTLNNNRYIRPRYARPPGYGLIDLI